MADLKPEDLVRGGVYCWKHDPQRVLAYRGKKGNWHQFDLTVRPGKVWCEVLDEDLHMLRTVHKDPVLTCPDCGSTSVTVTEEHAFMANGGDHYCHSVKAHDSDAKATCLDCRWEGQRQHLKEKNK